MNDQKTITIPDYEHAKLIACSISEAIIKIGSRSRIDCTKQAVRKTWKPLLTTGAFYLEEDLFTVAGGTNNKPGFLSLKDLQTGEEIIRCSFRQGLCVDVTLSLYNSDQYASFMESIKAQGFKYSRFRRWELPGENYLWRVEKNSPDEYLAVCRRLRPIKTVITRLAA